MKGYVPFEYPKWIGDVLVRNSAEESALRGTPAKVVAAVRATELARPPSPAGLRMRRTRERRRESKLSIRCEISTVHIEALANAGFIDPAMRDDRAEVAQAVGRSLDCLSRSGQRAVLRAV